MMKRKSVYKCANCKHEKIEIPGTCLLCPRCNSVMTETQKGIITKGARS